MCVHGLRARIWLRGGGEACLPWQCGPPVLRSWSVTRPAAARAGQQGVTVCGPRGDCGVREAWVYGVAGGLEDWVHGAPPLRAKRGSTAR